MFPIAVQTAGPNGLIFFERTQGYSGGNIGYLKNSFSTFKFFFKFYCQHWANLKILKGY